MRNRVRRAKWQRFTVTAVTGCAILLSVSGWLFAGDAAAISDLANELVKRAGIDRGVCLVAGGDSNLALEVARSSNLLVVVREPDAAKVAALRKLADADGLGIDRLSVEWGPLTTLPYAENLIDVVIATPDAVPQKEVLRVLRPQGKAIIGGGKAWKVTTKPPLKGAGEWSHWEHGPDNNPVSEDTVIKAPYMTQFMAQPYYIGMPSITTAAGGRTFLAIGHIAHHRREWNMLNKLIARNGYNGIVLWQRNLPEGYLVHRSAFVATKDTFHMIDGNRCLMLDPQTGKETGQIRVPGVNGEWKWMVMQDGILYVLAGKKSPGVQTTKGDRTFGGWSWADLSRGYYGKSGNYRVENIPWGFGTTLAAYDMQKKQLLWKHTEKKPIDSRSLSMGDGKIFLYCPGLHLRCVDAGKGKVVWTTKDRKVLDLIESREKRLTSTPGFKTQTMAMFTPEALIIQGQTRTNVVAISTQDGYLLWKKEKVTNNPNAIFVDGKVILGVGKNGSHVAIEPSTGNVLEDLKFRKTACTRLTACSDSFFVRGEGTLRFDRETKKVLIDGSARPACNDGALPANGLLYIGPWQCDCNLALIGRIARCSAGDFRFNRKATEAERLTRGDGDLKKVEPLEEFVPDDWPTFRANNHRTAGTSAAVAESVATKWTYTPNVSHVPTAPTSAGGLVFVSGENGKVQALDSQTGKLRWQFATPSPIKAPPTIAGGRVYFGSGDGHVYGVEAATGRLLWRFRAAPVERQIMVYGNLCSTWPVNSGVLVEDGVAYCAAGIIDYDGTYVYALDAQTGEIKWQNNSSGHLDAELRKGVSAAGNLSIQGGQLLLAGGNQISPAPYDLESGEFIGKPTRLGRPNRTHGGQFVGVFGDYAISGGRILYSSPRNVSSKNSYTVVSPERRQTFSFGGIPPAWNGTTVAMVNFLRGKLTCCDVEKVAEGIAKGAKGGRRANLVSALKSGGAVRWQSDLGESNKFEALSLAVCRNAVVAVVQQQQKFRSQPQWYVVAFNAKTGKPFWRHEIRTEPFPGGLLVDKDGQAVVTMLNGSVLCLGAKQ